MSTHTAYKGRMVPVLSDHQHITCTIISGISSLLKPVLGISLPVIAAFTCGCSKELPERKEKIAFNIVCDGTEHNVQMENVSVFSFDADSLGRLDAYQYFPHISDRIRIATTSGRKHIYLCANMNLTEEEILSVNTMDDLKERFCMLEDVRRKYPVMLGEIETDTGIDMNPVINMKPMTSEIVLRSVCCCFQGTPYEGECITDARIYLINVNAQCSLIESSKEMRRLVNIGMLSQEDIGNFREQDIIMQEIDQDIGEEPICQDISLLCFHNFCADESPGSPFTRLVLEGKIQGETWYWPLTINRTEGGNGVRNNSRHVFDIKIRRKGSQDPDTELTIEECEIMMEVKEWKIKEESTVWF